MSRCPCCDQHVPEPAPDPYERVLSEDEVAYNKKFCENFLANVVFGELPNESD